MSNQIVVTSIKVKIDKSPAMARDKVDCIIVTLGDSSGYESSRYFYIDSVGSLKK